METVIDNNGENNSFRQPNQGKNKKRVKNKSKEDTKGETTGEEDAEGDDNAKTASDEPSAGSIVIVDEETGSTSAESSNTQAQERLVEQLETAL